MEVDEKTRIQVREFMYKLFTSNSSYYSPAEEVAHHLGMPVETITDVLEDLFSKEHSLKEEEPVTRSKELEPCLLKL